MHDTSDERLIGRRPAALLPAWLCEMSLLQLRAAALAGNVLA